MMTALSTSPGPSPSYWTLGLGDAAYVCVITTHTHRTPAWQHGAAGPSIINYKLVQLTGPVKPQGPCCNLSLTNIDVITILITRGLATYDPYLSIHHLYLDIVLIQLHLCIRH